ncbi:TetR/AcrR family transcriptional regulator [Parendozoicomonas haliclonae]|uniref:Putative HTH-type transcriptional regulator YvdT n=1 Tax=Parendozoicomonas haliclonae TaxID=1960125 RepID=A0A1X7AJX2_9GAMM|nr:TetR/AcrR family transcriptional regulator [Parendozoicomonas haliclonae]SMA47340.1 putative HTH-type transcriptional regulator YvdT [Parendozoicomonas haliclonae]
MSDTTLTPQKTNQVRRTPSQERSRSRVDAILSSTRELILEKGSARLKIHELAERAGVTPSSIYQYFPNKRAIIHALDKSYIDATNELLSSRLEGINSLEQGFQVLEDLLIDYYEWYKSEPVITDIWYSMATDKTKNDMEVQSSRESAAIIVEALSPFVDAEDLDDLKSYAMLLAHLVGSTIRLCAQSEEDEAMKLINAFKTLIRSFRLSLVYKDIWNS